MLVGYFTTLLQLGSKKMKNKLKNSESALETLSVIVIALGSFLLLAFVVIIGYLISGFIVQLLWNYIIATLFNLQTITLLQGVGIAFCLSFVKGIFGLSSSKD